MKLKLAAAAVLMIAGLPLTAQAQQQQQRGSAAQNPPSAPNAENPPTGPKPTVADVRRVVGTISADKEKTKVYCEIVKLDDLIVQADQKKDNKQVEELAKQSDQMVQKLGPEYAALMVNLQQVDPASNEGKQMVEAFDTLEKGCVDK